MIKLNFQKAQTFLVIGNLDIDQVKNDLKIRLGDDQILAGEEVKIEDLRHLLHWLNLKPLSGSVKLVVITNADQITAETANTLLKTLEEPPPYAKIILTARDEGKILPTIQSRCQKFRLLTSLAAELPDFYLSPEELANITIKEKFDWAAKAAELDSSQVEEILVNWTGHFRQKMLAGEDCIITIQEISRARDLLQTNISVKLMLEHLLLQMPS